MSRWYAELPPLLKKQLDVFAGVLSSADVKGRKIRLVGHADASGSAEVNQTLSIKRAVATRDYLVQRGVNPTVLVIAGVGEREPVNPKDPLAPENRRVEIGRQ
ncbi:MAG: OmpA family protein [Pseudomonadota bacterium]|nr:OmpA family protein [Pseudomonadota bacterium]